MQKTTPSPPFDHPTAGLLIPVFALRRTDDLGIGDTFAVKEAIDFCARHQFKVLQILPIHDTMGDHSPYNPISSRALSPALLTINETEVPGLTSEHLSKHAPADWLVHLREGIVKHRLVHSLKFNLLQSAYHNFSTQNHHPLQNEFISFKHQQTTWLQPYTLFRALAMQYDHNPHWEQWRPEHQHPQRAENWLLSQSRKDQQHLHDLRETLAFIQWIAHRQWSSVRSHADSRQVLLMGEISFGVSKSSADVWLHPDLFDMDWSMGTRPVVYFDTNKDSERWGQNWGLPPYRWENHRSSNYSWLRDRVKTEAQYFHISRIDHLRGYFRAYMFPWQGGSQHTEFATLTPEQAAQHTGGRMPRFVPGPDEDPTTSKINDLQGRELIKVIREAAGEMYLFAEIMGAMPDYMREALEDLSLPNLTFPLLEVDEIGNLIPPQNYRKLSLASFGNHDHAPLAENYQKYLSEHLQHPSTTTPLQRLLNFANWQHSPPSELSDDLLGSLQEQLFQTPCILAVLLISDLLGTHHRFNLPGSYGDHTWCERLDLPLTELEKHQSIGPRIITAAKLAQQTGRTG